MSYLLIENDEDLEFLNGELLKKRVIGLDTEFRRTTKDNMRLALLQINDGEEIYLIDILKINDETIINELISSKKIIKVLHSCKEDIEAIYKWSGVVLNNIFDTQLAEAFLGKEFSISYQSLVLNNLDLHLKKDETQEFIIVLATKRKFAILKKIKISELLTRLDDEGKSNWYMQKIGYSVLRKK